MSARQVVGHRMALVMLCCVAQAGCDGDDKDSLAAEDAVSDRVEQAITSVYFPELGKGVNETETRTFGKCVVFPVLDKRPSSFSRHLFREFSIKSRNELNAKMGVSANLAAKGLWGSAAGHVAYFKDKEIDDEAFYWVVDAKYNLAHESIATNHPDFGLTSHAKKILEDFGWEGFHNECGTHFYVGRDLGAEYALLYEFSSRSDRFAEALSNSVRGGAFGVQAEGAFSRSVDIAKRQASLTVIADVVGGDHRIEAFASSAKELQEELRRLRRALGEHNHGVPLSWEAQSYEIFPEVKHAKERSRIDSMSAAIVETSLAQMYDRFTDNQQRIGALMKIQQRIQGNEITYPSLANELDSMRQMHDALLQQNREIASRAAGCIRQHSPDLCDFDDQPLPSHPSFPLHYALNGLGDWSVFLVPDVALNPTQDKMRPFLKFQAQPFDQQIAPTVYETKGRLVVSPSNIIYAFNGPNQNMKAIGTSDMRDLDHGVMQPSLCTGAYRSVCSLEFISPEQMHGAESYPDLQVSIFSADGTLSSKTVYHSRY